MQSLGVLLLLGLIGFGLFLAGANTWAWYHYQAAETAIDQGDYPKAEEHLRRCLTFWSHHGRAHYLLARVTRSLGQFDEAREQLAQCEQLAWSPEAIDLERTLLRAQQGEFAQLEGILVSLAEQDIPDAAAVLEVLSAQYIRNSLLGSALHWGERFLKHCPNNVRAMLAMAKIHQLSANASAALRYYRRALALQPDNDVIRWDLASALLQFREPRAALEHLERLRSRSGQAKDVMLSLSRCYRELGQRDRSRVILDQLLRRYPTDGDVLGERGKLAWQERRWIQAARWLRRSVEANPYDSATLYTLYLCLKRLGPSRQADADKYYTMFTQLTEDSRRLRELLIRGLTAHPRDPAFAFQVAQICLRTGSEKSGVYWLQKTIQFNPNHRGAHQALAKYYEKIGDREMAKKHRDTLAGRLYVKTVVPIPQR